VSCAAGALIGSGGSLTGVADFAGRDGMATGFTAAVRM
jgi:hypothetical protein